MNIAALELSLQEISAGVGLFITLCGVLVWALSTRFVGKQSFYFVRDKVLELEKQHELAKQPTQMIADKLDEMTAALKESAKAEAQRSEKMMAAIISIDKRVTVLENTPHCGGRRSHE